MEVTIGQAVGVARDICFVAALLFGIFKLGLWMKPAIDFFLDAKLFMADMRQSMKKLDASVDLLMTNHLFHLNEKMDKIIEITVQANQDRRDMGE